MAQGFCIALPPIDPVMQVARIASTRVTVLIALVLLCSLGAPARAQIAPSPSEIDAYTGLHRAAQSGDLAAVIALTDSNAPLEAQDSRGRTALHVAAFASHEDIVRALADAGADVNAFEHQAYDIVTIAAVADDLDMLDAALDVGTSPGNITSPYIGTALIAAAHLGHHEVVERLITAGAPLDHVNNLGWTAMIEAVILGDGGADHVKCLQALLNAGADKTIADRQGDTPLDHAKQRGFTDMIALLE